MIKIKFIERKLCKTIREHLQKKQITVIVGMRRTGKTTIVRQILSEVKSENKIYLDLERVDIRELFSQKNYDNIILSLSERGLNFKSKTYIALDEIQLLPEITSVLKYLYDNYDIKFIVTGSSSYYLKNLFLESLSGRKKIFELKTLSFGEYLTFRGIKFNETNFLKKKFVLSEYERLKNYYEDYIKFGGFPQVVLCEKSEDKKDIISDIISSYINIDIKSLADFKNDKEIYSILRLLASRISTRVNISKLSIITGISRITLNNYLDFFEKTYLIKRIPIISKDPVSEIVKAQKIFFCDNGIANFLHELGSGESFENAIFCQLSSYGELYYYSLKTGREIDFILNKEIAFEVKETPTLPDLFSLKELAFLAKIKNYMLIGKKPVEKFKDYIWGGDIK